MSDDEPDLPAAERRRLRREIRHYIEGHESPTWSEITTAVAEATGHDPTSVGHELTALHTTAFIRCETTADGEEVSLL
jgi:hypothetical protein